MEEKERLKGAATPPAGIVAEAKIRKRFADYVNCTLWKNNCTILLILLYLDAAAAVSQCCQLYIISEDQKLIFLKSVQMSIFDE